MTGFLSESDYLEWRKDVHWVNEVDSGLEGVGVYSLLWSVGSHNITNIIKNIVDQE
jgi:hypothetical protein